MSLIEHTGPARLGKRTKELVRRLHPDDIAVIDHTDLDRVSAEELVESGVRVVVNVAPSQSGRYPNPRSAPARAWRPPDRRRRRRPVRGALGRRAPHGSRRQPLPEQDLSRHGQSARGARARQSGSETSEDASPRRCRTSPTTRSATCATRASCSPRESTSALETSFRDRHALVVARGPGQARLEDRARLRPRLPAGARRRRRRCGGARGGGLEARRDRRRHGLGHGRHAALRRRDPRPRLPRGHAPGEARLQRLGVPFQTVAAPGISEDIALLLAHDKGAS